jgi:hypothetical protein
MHNSSRPFKDTQVFDWEVEPHDERPSEFAHSTGYSALSGFYVAPIASSRKRRSSGGSAQALMAGGLVVALGAAAMVGFVHLLRG